MASIRLSISIMHCSWSPDRATLLSLIESKIDKSLLCGFYISDDINKKGIWWNYKQALNTRPADSTHHIVLQDDMIPCDNFVPTLLEIIKNKPNDVIHFFASSHIYKQMYLDGYNWFSALGGVWGGSVILPSDHFNWHKWSDKYFNSKRIGKHLDDERQSIYLEFNNIPMFCISPGLTRHVGDISLINGQSGRYEYNFIEDGLQINWALNDNPIPDMGFIWGTPISKILNTLQVEFRHEFLNKYAAGSSKGLVAKIKSRKCFNI